MGWNLWW